MGLGKVITITDNTTGGSLTLTGAASAGAISNVGTAYTQSVSTVADINTAITAAFGTNLVGTGTAGSVAESITSTTDSFTVTSNDTTLLGAAPVVTGGIIGGAAKVNNVYIGDGTTASGTNTSIQTSISGLSAADLALSGDGLSTTTTAQAALTAITNAINSVSAQRGVIGASVNRLTAANGDMASQVTNLQSAANSIQNADIGKTVANMTQYNVLQSTGMAALQQSNQAQQAVLKLVQ